LDPRFSKMLIESVPLKASDTALSLVAIMSANSGASSDLLLFDRNASDSEKRLRLEAHSRFDSKYGDLMSWLLLFNHFQKIRAEQGGDGRDWAQRHFVNHRTLKMAIKIREQLRVQMADCFGHDALSKQSSNPMKAIRKVLARSLFMQSARRLDDGARTAKGQSTIFRLCTDNEAVSGQNVFVHPASKWSASGGKGPADWKWIVYLEVVLSTKPYLRGICSVKFQWMAELLPRISNKIQWIKDSPNDQSASSDNKVAVQSASIEYEPQKEIKSKEELKQRQREMDSVKARYLKRKMLRQKLKSM